MKEFRRSLALELAFLTCSLLTTLTPISASSERITLDPGEGPVGTGVTIEGSGFAPFAEVTIQFEEDRASTSPSPLYADDLGEFTVEFKIPQYTSAGNKTITATDNSDASSLASSVFLVLNSAPVADFHRSIFIAEDSPELITLEGSDVNGDPLTFFIVDNPSHGTLSDLDYDFGQVIYTPETGYIGSDKFSFEVNDGDLDSNKSTISIHIGDQGDDNNPPVPEDQLVNTDEDTAAPLAYSQSIFAKEDTSIYVNLSAGDPDDGNVSYSIIDYPLHGNLSGFHAERGTLIYTPLTEYSGPDSFTFKASDEYDDSETAIVSILITSVNDPPQALDQNLTMSENSIRITLAAFDAEDDPLTYSILDEPVRGILTGSAPDLTYSFTDPRFAGEDSFTFVVSDGESDGIGAVSITIGDAEELSRDITDVGDHETAEGGRGASVSSSGSSGNDKNDGSDGTSTRIHVEKGNTIIQLSWDHNHQSSGAESLLNLQFTDRMTRHPLGGHIWYDLVILDDDNNEIFSKQDLIALDSADVQNVAFPENAVYHVEVVVKGVIDKANNSVSQDGAYTGRAIGTVVVPEFSSYWLMILAAAVMSSAVATFRFAGKTSR